VISNPAPEPQYRMIAEWFRSVGLTPLAISKCTSVPVIAELVPASVGLSLLTRSTAGARKKVKILIARPAPPVAEVFCAFHRGRKVPGSDCGTLENLAS
jgi:hypothetical protein